MSLVVVVVVHGKWNYNQYFFFLPRENLKCSESILFPTWQMTEL